MHNILSESEYNIVMLSEELRHNHDKEVWCSILNNNILNNVAN